MTIESRAPRTAELIGTLIADPNSFERVQAARPGRIEAPEGGLAYVGKRVEKGELLGYLAPYIEAADKANIESQIAEAEARSGKLSTILSRYTARPDSVPQVKVDEIEGETEALRRKRAELQPSLVVREAIRAPATGVISVRGRTIHAAEFPLVVKAACAGVWDFDAAFEFGLETIIAGLAARAPKTVRSSKAWVRLP